MTLDEFKALETGDTVLGMHGEPGEIAYVKESYGVKSVAIRWAPDSPVTFTVTSDSTVWTHWRLPPEESEQSEMEL